MILTIDALQQLDDLSKGHRLTVLGGKVRENTRSEGNLFVKVAFGKAKVAKFKLWWYLCTEVCIHDTEWIQVSDVVASHLVGPDKQLYLMRECMLT